MANITAIYNTFSIWALVFSILFLGSPWDLRQAIAVLLGVFGVVLVAFGSMRKGQDTVGAQDAVISYALLGNALALLGALSMAAYEIMYKIIGSTSEDEHKGFQPVASSAEHADAGDTQGNETEAQPALPFGMHPIAMTTGIGFVTLTVFWIPLIIAHITGAEVIVAPPNWETAWWILLGIVCGVIFNGCFTILLGLWGPVLASMSCLMTTVLVQLTDLALGVPSTWINLGGCAIITVSFVLLLPWGQQGE
ncbi:hypothetical protein MVES1_001939 [Malassezia vespertilionis]|uniref:EamA domain-containing protein n=1 Tax=Malassezia vespertilionis TaxID=2020962 RepID=A0A2N1JCJ7_9BASI|nr:uncharacterized protein MVES1_001939 [Malassezia vespertilionis]PKI84257.1 hypothetical protein MVES_001837 [Malassezia vespertilionis]WFD06586.1 hypothetical protein MVES1_001939 [Malassezia vespertilionis]